LVGGDQHRLAGGAAVLGHLLPDDVGGGAEDLADVVDGPAVGAPGGRAVLAVEAGQLAVVAAVGVADPDVVVRRAAVAPAEGVAGAADVGDAVAARCVDALAALASADPADPPALDGDAVQAGLARVVG